MAIPTIVANAPSVNYPLARERCPFCFWEFVSVPCCHRPNHGIGTECPRCHQIFVSAAAPEVAP